MSVPESELNFLMKTREEVQRSLDKEKIEVNQMANSLFSLWKQICDERTKNKFVTTNLTLKVHKQIDGGQ